MLLEATTVRPIRFHFADGETVRLEPGHPIDLPDERARRLLQKASGKVKIVSVSPVSVAPGDRIVWRSPLFGELSGEVLGLTEDGRVDVFHPLTQQVCTIPLAWVTGEAREADR